MITIVLAGLIIPFILITDFFPFLRFGMFAEPIKKDVQTEQFLVYQTNNKRKTLFNPELIGINPNTFHYLCRNYYYRNELELFSEKIFSTTSTEIKKIEILKITTNSSHQTKDTLKIGSYNRK